MSEDLSKAESTAIETVKKVSYDEKNIRTLSDMEHIRTRPGMYIGRLGDGSHAEDGV